MVVVVVVVVVAVAAAADQYSIRFELVNADIRVKELCITVIMLCMQAYLCLCAYVYVCYSRSLARVCVCVCGNAVEITCIYCLCRNDAPYYYTVSEYLSWPSFYVPVFDTNCFMLS